MKTFAVWVKERKDSHVAGQRHTKGAATEVEEDHQDEEDKEIRRTGPKTKTKASTKPRTSQRRRLSTRASTRTRPKAPGQRCHSNHHSASPSNPSSPGKRLTSGYGRRGATAVQGRPDAIDESDPERWRPIGGCKGDV